MRAAILLIVILNVFTLLSTAQISGSLIDIKAEPVIGATVKLFSIQDSALIAGTVTDIRGKFQFAYMTEGGYFIEVSAISYKSNSGFQFGINETLKELILPPIVLFPQKYELGEVVVSARKPPITYDIDRTVINVESFSGNLSSSTAEILEKAPGVIVDEQGSIRLNGKANVTILIDNKPTFMSGQELLSYLRSLPAGVLDKVELIDNPPARYTANGGAIINIVLKRNIVSGITGNVNVSMSQGETTRHTEWLYLNHRSRKWNMYINGGYNRGANYYDVLFNRKTYDSDNKLIKNSWVTNNELFHNNARFARLGGDYYLKSNAVLGFIINFQSIPRSTANHIFSNVKDYLNSSELQGRGFNNGEFAWNNRVANVNYQQKFRKNSAELSADFTVYRTKAFSTEEFLSESGNVKQQFVYISSTNTSVYNAKSDYSQSINNQYKFDAGFAVNYFKNDPKINHYDIVNSAQQYNAAKSNQLIYHENINSAYVNIRNSGKVVSSQLGVRLENISLDGYVVPNQTQGEKRFSQKYTKVFPTAYLTFKMDSMSNYLVTLSYSKRVRRPAWSNFNPFVRYIDQFTNETGNVGLLPSISHYMDLTFIFKRALNVKVSYLFSDDLFFNTLEVINDQVLSKPYNFGIEKSWYFSIGYSKKLIRWWTVNYNFQASNSFVSGSINTTKLAYRVNNLGLRFYNQFQISKKVSADFTFTYFGKETAQQMETQPRYIAYGGIGIKMLKDKGTLKVSMEDIFYTTKRKGVVLGVDRSAIYRESEFDSRRIAVAFSYGFGKEKYQRKRKHQLQEINY